MQIINLTPHALNVRQSNGDFIHIAASGNIARVSTSKEFMCNVHGIDISFQKTGDIEGLPEEKHGVLLITSTMVRLAAQGLNRADVVSPGDLIRNDEGQPIGCDGLTMN